MASLLTLDTNIAIYAFSHDARAPTARDILTNVHFISVQLLNEYTNTALRKRRLAWSEVHADLGVITQTVPTILPVDPVAHKVAVRVAERYQLSFYDALMLAVALAGGARTIYSEDMQDGLLIDDTLRIVDPFR